MRDHWFSSALISTIDVIKIVFSFTMKNNSIQKCMNETPTENCNKKVDLFQKAGLIAFGVQGFLMVINYNFIIIILYYYDLLFIKKFSFVRLVLVCLYGFVANNL